MSALIAELEENETTGIAKVKRALYSLCRTFDRMAQRGDRTVPVILNIKLDQETAACRDITVKLKHEGTERECGLHIDEIRENVKPPAFCQKKGRISLRIVIRKKDRFGQIMSRVAKCIRQFAANIRREVNQIRFARNHGLPECLKRHTNRRRAAERWISHRIHMVQVPRFSYRF